MTAVVWWGCPIVKCQSASPLGKRKENVNSERLVQNMTSAVERSQCWRLQCHQLNVWTVVSVTLAGYGRTLIGQWPVEWQKLRPFLDMRADVGKLWPVVMCRDRVNSKDEFKITSGFYKMTFYMKPGNLKNNKKKFYYGMVLLFWNGFYSEYFQEM